ncbi:MAG: hypothetical protein V4471_06375 [Pseudomonadota bacterium]
MFKKNIRKKRFLVDDVKTLSRYYSAAEEVLTLAYEYSDEALANKDYVEQVQITLEQFNNFGLARFIYRPGFDNIPLQPGCPIDEMSLRKKYLNKFTFGLSEDDLSFKHLTNSYGVSSLEEIIETVKVLNLTLTSLGNFAGINANIKEPLYQLQAVGTLMKQIFLLFGVNSPIHLNTNCTNDIIYTNTTVTYECNNNSDDDNCLLFSFLNGSAIYECEKLIDENVNFTPFSLFSLTQYSKKIFHPLLILNETRITEILNGYQFTSELQKDYFDLLTSYQGSSHLVTYQDFSALAQAIYLIGADSMMGRTFNMPYYHLMNGMYRPLADEEKFNRLISAFRQAENFNYPILAQNDLNLTVFNDTVFKIDLARKLKVVSLTPIPVHCYLEQQPVQFKGSLQVNEDCMLIGYSQTADNFTLDIVLSNNLTEISRFINLNIKEKNKPLTTIVLGKRSVAHTLSEALELDLAALCHAVSLPDRDALKCNSFDLPENISLANCSILGINSEKDYNFTVTFFNAAADKNCIVQLLSANDSALVKNLIEQNSSIFINKPLSLNNESNITNYYARYAREDYMLSINDAANTVRFIVANDNYLQQFNYLLTIPLFHGVFEGCIDNIVLSPVAKSILKLLPRIGLVSINYLSTLQFPFLFFYSVLESFVASHLKAKNNDHFRYAVSLSLFLLVAELEYGFSNLWVLADKPQFWPALTDRLNQLFVQMLWAPTVKMAGYLLGVSIMDCCNKSAMQENNTPTDVRSDSIEREARCQQSHFFNSLKSVKDTVFSSKIRRVPRLFYNQFSPIVPQQAANDIQVHGNFSKFYRTRNSI